MPIKKLTISGLRGFGGPQTLDLAVPNDKPGTGLTTLVGPNNGGKSTIVEALRAVGSNQNASFTEGKRNKQALDRISIQATDESGLTHELKTVDGGGSETEWVRPQRHKAFPRLYVLPSRRYFGTFFGRSIMEREQYTRGYALPANRGSPMDQFPYRLFRVLANRTAFDKVLGRVLEPVPDWTIEQNDNGNYYLRFNTGQGYHNSDGLGEGLVSLFFIVDALYDSEAGEVIAVDEPELSLHPSLQRRLASLLCDYSATRQIICATHSPYFVDIGAFVDGGVIARIHKRSNESIISPLSRDSAKRIGGFLENLNNPHILGLDAREAFFLDDGVILVEGQEDVLIYQKILADMGQSVKGTFFGWGVGGADNLRTVASILKDLGFVHVVGILDKNKENLIPELQRELPEYRFFAIPTDNVRSKPHKPETPAVTGLSDTQGNLKPEYKDDLVKIFDKIRGFLSS